MERQESGQVEREFWAGGHELNFEIAPTTITVPLLLNCRAHGNCQARL